MNVQIKNFVGVFEGAFTKEYCDDVIQQYETAIEAGYGLTRQEINKHELKTVKCDTQLFNTLDNVQVPLRNIKNFNEVLWGSCYPLYVDQFAVLKDAGRHNNFSFKIQKTNPGEGYHIWHFESCNRELSNRLLVWILYLNDVEEGGETEFLYQSMRVKPKAGTLVLWPAGFTHAHRGNPPLSNSKYIVTGWIEF